MPSFKIITTAVIFIGFASPAHAQYMDTLKIVDQKMNDSSLKINYQNGKTKYKFSPKSLIIPGVMIAYGLTALENDGLKNINKEFKDEVYAENLHKKVSIDNYLQFAPAASVYALNAMGIKSKNNFRDRSMIFLMSNIILTGSVHSLKKITAVQRPDGGAYTSFPSGHTAEAFANAELMRQEYKDVSPWYGVAGYVMAATTGYLRMYNNKHWLSDVVAGAGVGIVSTKLAYWIYPAIKRKLFKDKNMNAMFIPFYQSGGGGLAFVYNFKH